MVGKPKVGTPGYADFAGDVDASAVEFHSKLTVTCGVG